MIKKNHKQVGLKIFSESRMFGASIVRAKRERERKERLARGEDPPIIPYIKPHDVSYDDPSVKTPIAFLDTLSNT